MLPEFVFSDVCVPCTRMASRLPLCELISVLYSRSGILELLDDDDDDERGEVRTRMEPEDVLRTRTAGFWGSSVEALCSETVMSMFPDVVWMESRS